MAFKHKKVHKEPPELVSLIDMIFILLVFFLVTSFAIKMPLQERALLVPTPENKTGHAQILIQIIESDSGLIDAQQFLWIDAQATQDVVRWERELFYLPDNQKDREILKRLIQKYTFGRAAFYNRLQAFLRQAREQQQKTYFAMIRCPDEIPYIHVMELLSRLSDAGNIQYGCLGGTLQEIRESRVSRHVYQGNQVLRIDL